MAELWHWISTHPAQCLFVMLLAGLAVAAVYYLFTCFRTVPEGHVAIVERLEKFARTAGPGLYFLRPMEEEVARLYVRQREARAVVPNVFTEGGLPVTVNLRYSYSLDPKYMNRDEVYYSDETRDEQLRTLLKRVFQDLMYQLEQMPAPRGKAPAKGEDRDRVNIERLFSPFAGTKARLVQTALEPAVRDALRPHGIIVTAAPVLINGLTLPPEISTAYIDLLSADFDSSARSDFIRRVRKAAPNMTEPGLIQLLNIIQNPSAAIQSVFSGGMLNTEVLLQGSQSATRHVIQPGDRTSGVGHEAGHDTGRDAGITPESGVQAKSSQPAPSFEITRPGSIQKQPPAAKPSTSAGMPPSPSLGGMDSDYPLTEEDNELLKTTREEGP